MAQVVLLRGVNVGGHRRFKPARLAKQLQHLGAVNIGAAGTFVIGARISKARLQSEFARLLPFAAAIVICDGRDLTALLAHPAFDRDRAQAGITRFVSVLARSPQMNPALPTTLPPDGRWLVKVHAREGRFVLGEYRRDMKVIGYLGMLDRMFGVPVTTRNWNTLIAIANVLNIEI